MSLSLAHRPRGRVLSTSGVSAAVTDSGGTALFTATTHGLSTSDFLYVKGLINSYNGTWRVTVVDPNTFTLTYEEGTPLLFTVAATVTFYKTVATNDWGSVHLPLVYTLSSSLWPINGADTARTVSSFANFNGYTAVSLSGTLHTGSTTLEKVVVSGTTSLDGVYTILNWISGSSIVIDLPYSASNSFSGGTVQYYYFNYHAIIRVYAGLISSHPLADLNPIEQVAEIKCIPNSLGYIEVNVADFVKKKINILTNNLLLDGMPNNTDAWCYYYISYAESYDDSDGYTVEQFTDSFTSDEATPLIAINAKLPFKSVSYGYLNSYVNVAAPAAPQKFLTLFTRPKLFPGYYFDISWINNQASAVTITRTVYVDNVVVDVFTDSPTNYELGVYRYAIEQSGHAEDTITIQLHGPEDSETLTIDVLTACAPQNINISWLNYLGGFDYWNFTARKTDYIDILESKTQQKNIFNDWPNSHGEFADTIEQQTVRRSKNMLRIESQNLTREQVDGIKWLFSSPLVQIVNSVYDRRTIIVDARTVELYKDQQDMFTLGFSAMYTDELPAQSL